MNTYLLDDDVNYKILILYILKDLNTDIKRIIYEKLLTYEIFEETTQSWAELIIPDDFDIDLYNDLELFINQWLIIYTYNSGEKQRKK